MPRVLVVDDESSVRLTLQATFEQESWPVECAEDVEEALEKLKGGTFDLLLVDKNLPRLSGLDLVERVRKSDDRPAIVMMTGYSSTESATEALNLDIDGYLEKPFESLEAVFEVAQATVEKRAEWLATRVPGTPKEALDVKVVIAATGQEALDRLTGPIEPDRAKIRLVESESELSKAIDEAAPDAVILDGAFADDLCGAVAAAKSRAPLATFLVVYSGTLPLPFLQSLIDLGVKGLLKPGPYAHSINEMLEKIWMRKTLLGSDRG